MMRRAPAVLSATIAGTAAVLGFHAHAPTPTAAAGAPVSTAGGKASTGAVVPTQYGNTQLRVTVANGKITAVEALQLPANEPKSVQISSYAEPLLRQSALTKQTGTIDAVSGATYTSDSYAASLQSALDQLGFQAAPAG